VEIPRRKYIICIKFCEPTLFVVLQIRILSNYKLQINNAKPSAFAFFYNIRKSINKTSQQLFLLGVLLLIIWDVIKWIYLRYWGYNYALLNQVSLGAVVWTTTLMCDVLFLKMVRHLWPITRGCIIPALWQRQQCGTIRQHLQICHYTFDVCGPWFVLAGDIKNHKSGKHSENS
jgi:hypothetical protein